MPKTQPHFSPGEFVALVSALAGSFRVTFTRADGLGTQVYGIARRVMWNDISTPRAERPARFQRWGYRYVDGTRRFRRGRIFVDGGVNAR